ncbi:MAG: hypothetical protein KKD44_23150 [Proteobacteria bacterium]|nr:hypothetical protein [Pseudomonadota bacterium]
MKFPTEQNNKYHQNPRLTSSLIQVVLVAWKALAEIEDQSRKFELDMAVMLSRLGERGDCVKEDSAVYGFEQIDFDPEGTKSQPTDALDAHSSGHYLFNRF